MTRAGRALQVLAAAALLGACRCAAPERSVHVVDPDRELRVSVHERRDVALVDLRAKHGIGQAEFTFGRPLRAVRFLLHTQGLEQFRLEWAEGALEIAVRRDGSLRQTALERGRATRELEPRDPRWMPVRMQWTPQGTQHTRQLEAVEIETPPAFRPGVVPRCRVSWVDFFR